ncbi:MAG TPA: GntR family transcriptional regulator [Burkholderiaceae bacterium]|nr:GntR family transcriptional regulator [Burkholderiaceae bacterium]
MSAQLPLPKYHRIYLVLREQLQEGRFDAGLPGEIALMQQFGVARVTVRRALERLAGEGLIQRSPGRGTTAIRSAATAGAPARGGVPPKPRLGGLLESIVSMGLRTSVRVIELERIKASDAVAQALDIAPRAPVQRAIRVRSTTEGPLSHITTYVPFELTRHFGRRELARKPILVLLEESGVRVGRASQSISASLADAVVAERLGVVVGSALLAVRRLILDVDERPVQWLHGLYRPDRYQYEMALSRVGDIDAKVWVRQDPSTHFH